MTKGLGFTSLKGGVSGDAVRASQHGRHGWQPRMRLLRPLSKTWRKQPRF